MATQKKRSHKKKVKKATAKPTKKDAIEKEQTKITPYPRAGDNPAFEGVLDQIGREAEKPRQAPPGKAAGKSTESPGAVLLTPDDVAEWVAWPFLLWSQGQELPGLALHPKEALSVAEPLAAILNRHAIGGVIPPDLLDGLRAAARLTPIMTDRVAAIKKERARRGTGDSSNPRKPTNVSATTAHVRQQQGGNATKPIEV